MTTQLFDWEQPLLSLANENSGPLRIVNYRDGHDDELLYWGYRYCGRVTSLHSRSFYMASRLLPKTKRDAARALYAFCRTTDDLVDSGKGNARELLESWKRRMLHVDVASHDVIALAWNDTCVRYKIPAAYAEQLIDGVARDLVKMRYQTFAELTEYCYGVASTVGLMAMHIVGFEGEEAIPYAIRLGVALQLTNILRDVAEDWRMGRLYLPLEELDSFGLSEEDIERGVVTNRWREFMRFQIERTRYLYEQAWPGLAMLALDGRVAIAAASDFYSAILDDIEEHDYDVFSRRAFVSRWGKIGRLPGLYWRTRIKPALRGWRS